MGEVRRCDARCHFAEQAKCSCWCGGIFHGARGAAARAAFRSAFDGDIPPEGEPRQRDMFDPDRWDRAMESAAVAAGMVR